MEGRQPWTTVPPRPPRADRRIDEEPRRIEERRRLELERRRLEEDRPRLEIGVTPLDPGPRRPPLEAAPYDDEDVDEAMDEDRRGRLRPEGGGRLVLRRASRAVRSEREPVSCPTPLYQPVPYWSARAGADEPVEERELSGQLHLGAGWTIPGAGRAELGARLMLPHGWNLEAAYSLYVEPVTDQEIYVLALGRAGVSNRVAEDRAIHVRLGGALRHLQDWEGPALGADVTLGVDMFLGDPVVLSAEVFAGVVGAAWLLQARASIGFLIDIVELQVGYDHVVLEPIAGGPGGMLTGPFLGVRLWL